MLENTIPNTDPWKGCGESVVDATDLQSRAQDILECVADTLNRKFDHGNVPDVGNISVNRRRGVHSSNDSDSDTR